MGREEQRGFKVAALGEIAIRCRDMDAMEAFYADVIGLERLARRESGIVFFRYRLKITEPSVPRQEPPSWFHSKKAG